MSWILQQIATICCQNLYVMATQLLFHFHQIFIRQILLTCFVIIVGLCDWLWITVLFLTTIFFIDNFPCSAESCILPRVGETFTASHTQHWCHIYLQNIYTKENPPNASNTLHPSSPTNRLQMYAQLWSPVSLCRFIVLPQTIGLVEDDCHALLRNRRSLDLFYIPGFIYWFITYLIQTKIAWAVKLQYALQNQSKFFVFSYCQYTAMYCIIISNVLG